MSKDKYFDQFLKNDEGIEIKPAPTADRYMPRKGEFTFQIKCRARGYCRNWQKKEVKRCIYCKHNQFHIIPKDGFAIEDNLDSIVPGVRVLP